MPALTALVPSPGLLLRPCVLLLLRPCKVSIVDQLRSPCFLRAPAMQAFMQTQAPPWDITASVVLVVAGCLVAGLGDFTFDLAGCVW